MTDAEKNGIKAERDGCKALKRLNFPLRKGWVFRNLYIPTRGTGTTEADLVFVSRKGIFVIECKNLSGTFYGSEYDHDWTNVKVWGKERNRKERTLYNPVLQNRTHVDSLRQYIGGNVPFYSAILFSDKADYSKLRVSDRILLMSLSEVKEKFGGKLSEMKPAMKRREAKKIAKRLRPLKRAGKKAKAEHMELIRRINEHPYICPLCGRRLEEKVVERGEHKGRRFLACTGYPACKYTRNI